MVMELLVSLRSALADAPYAVACALEPRHLYSAATLSPALWARDLAGAERMADGSIGTEMSARTAERPPAAPRRRCISFYREGFLLHARY